MVARLAGGGGADSIVEAGEAWRKAVCLLGYYCPVTEGTLYTFD